MYQPKVMLNDAPVGVNPRRFYSVDRQAICYVLGIGLKLPTEELEWTVPIPLFNVPLHWINGVEYFWPTYTSHVGQKVAQVFDRGVDWRGQPRTCITHVTMDKSYIGNFNVRLKGFKPAYRTVLRWDSNLNKQVEVKQRLKTSKQRLEVKCQHCEQWVPFSRLGQHMYTPSGERSKTCVNLKYKRSK